MTNKTKFSAAALFSAAVLGGAFFVTSNTVNAASEATAETGHAYVSFDNNKPNSIPNPSDPNSSTPVPSENSTGETGDLTLDAIPASLNFGTNATGTTEIPLLSNSDAKATNNPYSKGSDGNGIATTDASGYVFTQITKSVKDDNAYLLSATLSNFKGTDGQDALKGATITLANGQAKLLTGTAGNLAFTATSAEKITNNSGSAIVLDAGGKQVNITDAATQTGTTQQQWKTEDVSLQVPATEALKGDYTANITWTLAVVPQAPEPEPEN